MHPNKQEPPILRRRTELAKSYEQALLAAGSTPNVPQMAPKLIPGNLGTPDINLTTNVYGLQVSSNFRVFRYDVRISGIVRNKPEIKIDFTGACRADVIRIDNRHRCREVFLMFKLLYSATLFKDITCIYDEGMSFTIDCTSLDKDLFAQYSTCEIKLAKVASGFELSPSQFRQALTSDVSAKNTYNQYMNIATSQYIFFNPFDYVILSASEAYLISAEEYGFTLADTPSFHSNQTFLSLGCHKNVNFIEGPKGQGNCFPGMVVACKKTAFHSTELVSDKAFCYLTNIDLASANDIKKLAKVFKGMYVEIEYRNYKQVLLINDIISGNARSHFIDLKEKGSMTVEAYFKLKYDIALKHPHLPLIEVKNRQGPSYYPMELCRMCDNQRVRINQQHPKQVEEMIKVCAIPPAKLQQQINNVVTSLHLHANEVLNTGISTIPQPLTLNSARVLRHPTLKFSDDPIEINKDGTWPTPHTKFLIPANLSNWAVFGFISPKEDFTIEDLEQFIRKYMQEAKLRGMRVEDPQHVETINCTTDYVKYKINFAAISKGEFLLCVHSDVAEIHSCMKLAEKMNGIITQGILVKTARDIVLKGLPATLSNIVNKTNVKLRGLNYSLYLDNPISAKVLADGIMFIGIGTSHPNWSERDSLPSNQLITNSGSNGNGLSDINDNGIGANAENGNKHSSNDSSDRLLHLDEHYGYLPSVIGYSANMGSHPFEFFGDFMLQEPCREEKPNKIRRIVEKCVQIYRENRKAEVQRIVIFRNGCSEGQFQNILKYEVPFIKLGLQAIKCPALFTIIVPNKQHSIRFFKTEIDEDDAPCDQNIAPGTVIDSGVVHPAYTEFFLNSHKALQGSAKTPRYTVVWNELNMSLNELESMTHSLCFAHQIINSPTSLPSPAYIANLYAERGRMMFTEWRETMRTDVDETFYSDVEERLCYLKPISSFYNRRVNA